MLRTIGEVIKRDDGKFKIRLKCGHILSYLLVKPPADNSVHNCDKCDLKGSGSGRIIGYLNNGSGRKGHR